LLFFWEGGEGGKNSDIISYKEKGTAYPSVLLRFFGGTCVVRFF
jgi:hypothetical protein